MMTDILAKLEAAINQQEARWYVALLVPRLNLSEEERLCVAEILFGHLGDEGLRPRVLDVIRALIETGSAAVRSRGRRLLDQL